MPVAIAICHKPTQEKVDNFLTLRQLVSMKARRLRQSAPLQTPAAKYRRYMSSPYSTMSLSSVFQTRNVMLKH